MTDREKELLAFVQYVAGLQDLFFTECSQAEEVVSRANAVLGKYDKSVDAEARSYPKCIKEWDNWATKFRRNLIWFILLSSGVVTGAIARRFFEDF